MADAGTSTSVESETDWFDRVVGQPGAVATLRAAVQAPVHAYLLVGRPGTGSATAARVFAGELLVRANPGTDPDRHRALALSDQHPAVTVVERVGASISVDQAREVVRRATLSPAEGALQVMVLTDFHLVAQAAPTLLKTIEEPPASTVFVILADDVPEELVTIASRCVRVDFGPVPTSDLVASLRAEGVSAELAEAAAVAASGDLDRARLLATDPALADRRAFWRSVPERVDGTGARVVELCDEALAQTETVVGPIEARHEEERAALEQELEDLGVRGGGRRKELEDRQKREVRRIRTDELRAGVALVAARYREALGHPDGAAAFSAVAGAVAQLEERLAHNPNERLALLAFLVDLPRLPR